jgi:hypothetical protein
MNIDRIRGALARAGQLDRRYIFAVMALAVALPFLFPFPMRARPSQATLGFDAALEKAMASEKPVMVGVDFGPQTMAEMEPILLALMHKLFRAKKRVVFLTFMAETSQLMRHYLADMEKRYDLKYGEDYVFLGYATAYFVAIYAMGTSIEEYFHADDRGISIKELPIMREVEKLDDVSAVINLASNTMPQHWITWGVAPFGIDLLVACTATQATDYFPFLQSGQIKGIIAGGRAGAEYESLMVDQGVLSEPGNATRGLASQSMAILAIIAFILAGNIGYFAGRGRGDAP